MKTDKQLQQDVMAELNWEPSLNSAQIGVEVKNGIVTLNGHVQSFAEKWNAERAAQRVLGVKALTLSLDVELPGEHKRNDFDIALSIENALQWMTQLTPQRIKVLVEKAWVTLTGEVVWHYQRQSAADAIRYITGVRGVTNNVTLKPQTSMTSVKTEIESALARLGRLHASQIKVDVIGNTVTLSGTTHGLNESRVALRSAWATPGVVAVHDKMTVLHDPD